MTIQFNLSFENLIAFQKNVIEHADTHQVKQRYFKWISTMIIFIVALLIMKLSLLTVGISLVLSIIYFILFPYLYNKVAFSWLTSQMKENDYAHIIGDYHVTFSDNGIDRDIRDENTHFPWNNFIKWQEDYDHYFLYVTDLQGLILSKNPDEMSQEETSHYRKVLEEQMTNKIE